MVRLQDDFYAAVNGEWEKTAVIPDDKPTTGAFMDMVQDIENLMLAVTDKWQAGQDLPEDPILQNFVKYHSLVADFKAREAAGVAPALPLLEEIKALASFEDFTSKLAAYELEGKPNLLPFSIAPDFMDARLNVLWAEAPSLILPDTSYYQEGNEQAKELLAAWRGMNERLLPQFGYSKEETTAILDRVEALDKELAQYVLSREEQAEYTKLYRPYNFEDFTAFVPELPLGAFMTEMLGELPETIIVPEDRFWKEFGARYYAKANWENIHAKLQLNAALAFTSYLTEEIRILSGEYSRVLSGIPEPRPQKKAALSLAEAPYNQALGLWYAGEKFSKKAKEDVENKVKNVIEVYKSRLQKADWLALETREKAILKLNSIVPHIGYPEKLPETYEKKIIDESKNLVENAQNLAKISIAHQWSKWNQPVDKSEWHMPANMVNAYYDPQQNQIVFPAAILQAPFYDLSQTASENYGGIGAVIAHEISHAFDTNGASFDENGSLKNWWKKEDYEAFKEKTQKVIDQFEGQDSYGAKVNGKLTVSENVADLGGIAAALEAAKQEKDFSAEEFFTNFARIWRMKARPEYMQLLASIDVHAPAKLRTNVQLPNFDDFFATFDVKEGDGMWRKPEDRVIIW